MASYLADIAGAIPFLPNVCMEYQAGEFIADKVLSKAIVPTYVGTYTQFQSASAFQVRDDLMVPGARANEVSFKTSIQPYMCQPHGTMDYFDYDLAATNPVAVNWARAKTKWLARIEKTNKELALVNLIQGGTSVKAVTIGGAAWWTLTHGVITSYNTSAYPIKDIETARQTLAMAPNVIAMGFDVWVGIKNHPNVLSQRNVNRSGPITVDEMAEMLGVKEIVVSELRYDASGNRGRSQSLAYAWAGTFFMGYRNPDDILIPEQITWAAQFLVENDEAPGPRVSQTMAHEEGWIVRAWEEPDRGVDGSLALGVYHKYGLVSIAADLGLTINMTATS
jgi:hypothetical protein